MVRGPKKHMKRLNAPKHWMLSKMGGIFAPKPAAGPHKTRECLPLSLIVRNRLKYALTRRESMMILMQKEIKIDGRVRTELNYPAGFMGACHTTAGAERAASRAFGARAALAAPAKRACPPLPPLLLRGVAGPSPPRCRCGLPSAVSYLSRPRRAPCPPLRPRRAAAPPRRAAQT